MSLAYQLEARSEHDVFVLFDNGLPGEKRICVAATIRKLASLENEICKRVIETRYGREALCQNHVDAETLRLEFLKYVIVHRGADPPRAWDLDLLKEVHSTSEKTMRDATARPVDADDFVPDEGDSLCGAAPSPAAAMELPTQQRTLRFKAAGQTVVMVMGRFTNPNIRTSVQIKVSGDPAVRPNSAYGAAVKGVNPKHLRLKKFLRRPRTKSALEMSIINRNTFFSAHEVQWTNGTTSHMLLPRGGKNRRFSPLLG
ncbi:MAG: hypothetical protein CL902_00515 [Dehalococcoidia bacterium]|nr:hypothetical protein [Dehalococcoidia bacterium]